MFSCSVYVCANTLLEVDDFYTLECIQSLQGDQKDRLGRDCQTIIWNHLQSLVEDSKVYKLIEKDCAADLGRLQCKPGTDDSDSRLLSCILNVKDNIQGAECRTIIERLELVAFSDFRTIKVFAQKCKTDVEKFNCGRLVNGNRQWSQGNFFFTM